MKILLAVFLSMVMLGAAPTNLRAEEDEGEGGGEVVTAPAELPVEWLPVEGLPDPTDNVIEEEDPYAVDEERYKQAVTDPLKEDDPCTHIQEMIDAFQEMEAESTDPYMDAFYERRIADLTQTQSENCQ